MTKKITPKERQMLIAIIESEYQNGQNDPIGCAVWTWSTTGWAGKSAGGIITSLVKKGLVGIDGAKGDEACIWITEAGYFAINGDGGFSYDRETERK